MSPVDPRSVTAVDKEIGLRLRERRKELGFSQAYVAGEIGITFQQMQKYEAGQNRVASATLLRLADILNTDPMSLLPRTKPSSNQVKGKADLQLRELRQAFQRIKSPQNRRLVLEMVRKLSGAQVKKRGSETRKG